MTKDTTILIFSRSAHVESNYKSFSRSLDFFQLQEKRLLKISRKTGLNVIVVDEQNQRGASFGEKFCNAIADTFNRGFSKLIILGNDCPQLKIKHLQYCINCLNSEKNCLGKSLDGGFYLLGLKKQSFNYNKFLNLSWNTAKVSSEMIQLLQKETEIGFTPTLSDIDNQRDFTRLLKLTRELYTDVILLLKSLQILVVSNFKTHSLTLKYSILSTFQNKAPPLLD